MCIECTGPQFAFSGRRKRGFTVRHDDPLYVHLTDSRVWWAGQEREGGRKRPFPPSPAAFPHISHVNE